MSRLPCLQVLGAIALAGAAMGQHGSDRHLPQNDCKTPMTHEYLMQPFKRFLSGSPASGGSSQNGGFGIHPSMSEGQMRLQMQEMETNLTSTRAASKLMPQFNGQPAQAKPKPKDPQKAAELESRLVTKRSEIVRNESALIALGKAFFWDTQVGSDNRTACASCHHGAGADTLRTRDVLFYLEEAKEGHPAIDKQFTQEDIGTHRLVPKDAAVVVGSPGIPRRVFAGIDPKGGPDLEARVTSSHDRKGLLGGDDSGYAAQWLDNLTAFVTGKARSPSADLRRRQVSPRHAPTVINAALHDRLFHDARARNVFNGFDHQGSDGAENLEEYLEADPLGKYRGGQSVAIWLPNSALASQAVLPPVHSAEMSYYGRHFYHLGQKLLKATPLRYQKVSATDSVLGTYAAPGLGLKGTYFQMIQAAFKPDWWQGLAEVPIDVAALKRLEEYDKGLGMKHNHADDFISKLDANMSLFWGLAVMAYEQTLISDQTAYDTKSMSALAERGLDVFRDKGCADCHLEPEFAGATYSHLYGPLMEFEGDPVPDALNEETTNEFTLGIAKLQQWMYEGPVAGKLPPNELVELMPLERITLLQKMGAKPTMHVYDNGFYNIGVTNTSQDNGIGGYGKSGFRPSEWFDRKTNVFHTREDAFGLKKVIGNLLIGRWKTNENDPLELSLAKREHYKNAMVDGAFKTPTLRNIALTGPYFHNGSYSTLRGVLEFYNRQGDFPKNGDLHPDMRPPAEPGEAPDMAMSESDMDALIAFFNSLTDPRVKYRRAPFDHPSISIPVGLTATGDEDYYTLDAVGRDGGKPVPTWQQRATAN